MGSLTCLLGSSGVMFNSLEKYNNSKICMVEMNKLDKDDEIHLHLQRWVNNTSYAKGLCSITLCSGNVKTHETTSAEMLSKGSGNLQWEYSSLSLQNTLEAHPHPQRNLPNNKTSKASPDPEGSNTEMWCVQIN